MVKENTAHCSFLEPVQGPEKPGLLSFLLVTLAVVLIRGKLSTEEKTILPLGALEVGLLPLVQPCLPHTKAHTV